MSDVMTIEKLKEAMALVPQPIGYALLLPSSHVDAIYKLTRSEFMQGDALYWLIVPRNFLAQAIKSVGAVPSDDVHSEAYRFNVFKDDIL